MIMIFMRTENDNDSHENLTNASASSVGIVFVCLHIAGHFVFIDQLVSQVIICASLADLLTQRKLLTTTLS